MLDIRPSCENCNKALPPNSKEALICSYECTWCIQCNDELLQNVCPNCGGGLVPRPIRPKQELLNNPPKGKVVYKPIDLDVYIPLREKLKDILPEDR